MILATGGFALNRDMVAQHAPGYLACDPVDVSAANGTFVGSGTANLTVVAPSLSASLSIDGATYAKGQTVSMTATVRNGGSNPLAPKIIDPGACNGSSVF